MRDCPNCRYRHKGICDAFLGYNTYQTNLDNLHKLEKSLVLRENLRIDLEPALNLKELFYEINNNFEPALNLKGLFYEIKNKFEPVLNLKNLFYELEVKNYVENTEEILKRKAKYENFKLLTDIQKVLQNCTHLTSK